MRGKRLRVRSFGAVGVAGVAGAVVALVLAGYSTPTGASAAGHPPSGSGIASTWSEPNADLANTRWVSGPINSRTVGTLGVAWTVPIKASASGFPGSYATTPVVSGGVMYTQDLASNVYAIDLRTGKLLWVTMFNSPDNGPNGVNVADGRVFGATPTSAFALDAKTGKLLWSREIIRNDNEGIDMAPGVNNGTVYISTVPGNLTKFYAGNGQAILWALDAATGKEKWKWAEVPADLWGNQQVNSGGGQWYPPAFDAQGNIYLGVGNPGPFVGTTAYPFGSSRPGPDLYTDSLVKLDARTGRMIWYHQVTPHDLYDWDLQDSPVLTSVRNRQVVLAAGKEGFVYEFDQATGHLLWKTSVGTHNGHDNDNLLTINGDYSAMPELPYTIMPGILGGVIGPLAIDGTTVYAAVNNLGAEWTSQTPPPVFPPFSSGTGEIVAIDLATGAIKWQHALGHSPYGGATVVNDLVFTTTFEGTITALKKNSGAVVWQAALPGGSNSPVAIDGDTLLGADGWPQDSSQQPQIVAYRLGAER